MSSVRWPPHGFFTNTNGRQIALTFSGVPQWRERHCMRTGSLGGWSCGSQLHQNDGYSIISCRMLTKSPQRRSSAASDLETYVSQLVDSGDFMLACHAMNLEPSATTHGLQIWFASGRRFFLRGPMNRSCL